MIEVTRENFSVDEEIKKMLDKHKDIGGIVSFVGVVRNVGYYKGEEKEVEKLEFECYEEMAKKKLDELKKSALDKYSIIDVTLIHRIGELKVGDRVVLILVGAKHRKDAFLACEYLIDELKKVVPIWKKEYAKDGSYWVE
ncbi:MAG: molybdopterin synthase catalytic subunit [Methanothermococcus sp.]|jgi:molybdopterin synthase catalytic subunit|uniref:molybdenum cofactor biosynthesis protein MoaE n=1 Tax=Methanothermococcus TaxID=155862 RepID=UPI000367F61D|nr:MULTISPECIES: molybdenum cofactor biosynthesis protein MoaE [Methanothermococcus]MDK2790711.1 molybdopterin synthase catalytic subunit [Methanothermococcus sp.]MDK2987529.1 molybdopterin synthase catalytic subunit [Methanothermococcus sp.]